MELLHEGVSHPVPSGGGNLGSGEGVWLRVQGAGVFPEHARIRVDRSGFVIVAATPEAAVLVNGSAVGTEPHRLADGDRIELGTETLTVCLSGAAHQLADTLAGVPSFRPTTPIQGSIRQPAVAAPDQSAAGVSSGGRGKAGWVVVAVALLAAVLYLLVGR